MNPEVPLYLSIAFLIAICFPVFMIAGWVRKYAEAALANRLFYGILTFYALYFTAVSVASYHGVFDEASLPPKIMRVTALPMLLFLMVLIFNTGFFKRLLQKTPVDQLILLHRFRLIGSFFIMLMLLDLLPTTFALIAGIGDVFTALSSIWVAKVWKAQKRSRKTIALIWNSIGLIDILLTATMATLLTKASIETGSLGVDVLASFPFCLIPAFAPPTIIFLHMSIYRKLLFKKFT